MKKGGGGEARTGKATEPDKTPRKKKPQRMRRAVVGPRAGAPWVRRGPGPGRHGGRPLAVTPIVYLRPRAGNPEKPPGGLFSRRVPASGPGRGPDRRGRGPLVPGRTRPSPREGPNERNIPATERKTPQTGLKNRNRNPPHPRNGENKKQTSGRPALRGRMSPTPLGRPGCRGARRAAAPGRARKVFRTTRDRHGRAPAFIKAQMTQQKQATAPRG